MGKKIRLKKNIQELSYEEIMKITGGVKFRRNDVIYKIGGSYFKVPDGVDDPSASVYRVPVMSVATPGRRAVKFLISYVIYRGKEYTEVTMYRRHYVGNQAYNFYKPGGKSVWIPKEINDQIIRGLITAGEYEYSPDGDIVEIIEIKPHPAQMKRYDNYETGLEDFLD